MPFLGLATSSDVGDLFSRLDEMEKNLNTASQCTMLINGVHVCSLPKYEKVVEPKDFRLGDMVNGTEKVCLHFDHLPDIVGSETYKKMAPYIGHGDFPDNYLCVDTSKTTQYFKAMAPISKQAEITQRLDNEDIYFDN